MPLSRREKEALGLWLPIVAVLGFLDFNRRGKGTLSECGRCLRRRISGRGWALAWAGFAYWLGRHIGED